MLKASRGTIVLLALFAGLLLMSTSLSAQSIYATLTGVVSDTSGAVVPNANITLKNQSSGDVRKTVSNGDGYFTFSSIPTGAYSVTVESSGFEKYEVTGLSFTGAEKRNLDISLKVGSSATQVDVISQADILAPVDSGEKSATLTTKELQNFTVVGRSAAEFIKVLPGFAIAGTGVENRASFTGETIGINGNGDGGSQSALNNAFAPNGTPTNSMDITADGAHVSDPGCNCATPVNPNTDMIQELKVLTSNFSAENSKGPIVMNTIAKSGGHDYHGEGYFYARNFALNANDWINNQKGIARPESKYYFPGGNLSGPVLIPHTNFNKNRDKLFFFAGFEYYKQTLDSGGVSGPLTATVPTSGMLNGDFTAGELAKLGVITASGSAPVVPTGTGFTNGVLSPSLINQSGLNYSKLYPAPNADPNLTGGYNYVKDIIFDQNSWQFMTREDYSISDNTKLFVRYNLQKETQQFPVSLWWRNGNSVPYPTPVLGKNQSQSVSASLTHVFNPTMTNEFVFGFTYIDFPNVFQDPKKVDRSALGINIPSIYKNSVSQIPAAGAWGGDLATIFNPGGFEAGGSKGLFADKYLPSVSDSLSKVWGTHTMKFGVYYEFIINDQPGNGFSNGWMIEAPWAGSGNDYADLLMGKVANYQEQNFNPLHNEAYHTMEFFAQDSWKVTRRLTLDYGLRVSHFGSWYDRQGIGFAVWDPSKYSSTAANTDYTGLLWHKRDSSVPLSGFPSRALWPGFRFGLAYDVFGNGSTVVRGGIGQFYFHTSQFTTGLDAPAGVQTKSVGPAAFDDIGNTNPGTGAIGTDALTKGEDKTPLTTSYSFTISQRIPGASLLEVSYVGNQSKDELCGTDNLCLVNAVPYGALLNLKGSGTDPNSLGSGDVDKYRPFTLYENLHASRHMYYSNYNSLQVSWVRQKGKYDISANYTYGKALGILSGGVAQPDTFNINNDYGPQPFDRRHIFNAAYSIELGNPIRNSAIGKAVVNGWQLSGITQVQSGSNLSANTTTGTNFSLNANGYGLSSLNDYYGVPTQKADGSANLVTVSARTILGTDNMVLQPILTCDPRKNLGKNQFVNGSCFALPTTPGQNGPAILPEIFGPAFFNSDLSLFKNWQFSESKKLQFRFSAYNFLNHPLWSFRNGSSNLNLVFDKNTGQLSNPNFGVTTEKLGHRVLQLAMKFYF
jgi:hypothetical protein